VQVAALATAAWVRRQPDVRVLPFTSRVVPTNVHASQSVPEITHALVRASGGGTNCSAPIRWLNQHRAAADVVVLISDNESWMDPSARPGTALMREWSTLRARYPGAKLVCIDLVPNRTLQAHGRDDVLNIGGFSDDVFGVIERFVRGTGTPGEWVRRIEEEAL
jgi:60 kDa SS-A/Ro ribonucleoprotein